MGRESEQTVTFRVPDGTNLDKLIAGLTGAINAHAIAISKLAENPEFPPDLAFVPQRLEIIHGLLFELNRKVDTMSTNIDRIEKEAADAAENVELVKTALEGLRTVSEQMKAEIASLREQVAKGQIDQTRLDAAAAKFEKADDDLDALVLPPAGGGGETPPDGGGTEG